MDEKLLDEFKLFIKDFIKTHVFFNSKQLATEFLIHIGRIRDAQQLRPWNDAPKLQKKLRMSIPNFLYQLAEKKCIQKHNTKSWESLVCDV